MKIASGVLLIFIASAAATAQTSNANAAVRDVVTTFEAAVQAKDLTQIERLVSPGILVFENGFRNDGWPDFRDHHLIPEFKHSTGSYASSIIKIDASGEMAWAYSRMDRAHVHNNPGQPDVWTVYVLRRESNTWKIVVLSWSVRRVNE
jgi:ketosteroid isomerase-like protein